MNNPQLFEPWLRRSNRFLGASARAATPVHPEPFSGYCPCQRPIPAPQPNAQCNRMVCSAPEARLKLDADICNGREIVLGRIDLTLFEMLWRAEGFQFPYIGCEPLRAASASVNMAARLQEEISQAIRNFGGYPASRCSGLPLLPDPAWAPIETPGCFLAQVDHRAMSILMLINHLSGQSLALRIGVCSICLAHEFDCTRHSLAVRRRLTPEVLRLLTAIPERFKPYFTGEHWIYEAIEERKSRAAA